MSALGPVETAHAFGAALRERSGGVGTPLPPVPETVRRIAATFGLSSFEGQVLTALFAATLRGTGEEMRAATLVALLDEGDWAALHAASPLVRRRLVTLSEERTVRLPEVVFAALLGVPALDPGLRARVVDLEPPTALAPSQERAARTARGSFAAGFVQIFGAGTDTRRRVAASAAGALGLRVVRLPSACVPTAPSERDELARIIERDARLAGVLVLYEAEDYGAAQAFLERFDLPVGLWIGADAPVPGISGAAVEVARPTTEEQQHVWEQFSGTRREAVRLAAQFDLELGDIADVGAAGEGRAWGECRRRARGGLDALAQRIDSRATWEDLVVPEPTATGLEQLVSQVKHRHRVMSEWGFGRKGSRGTGIAALFHGPSGTGKTLAAEVIAGVLELDLYRIDLSSVVSKYIGETEKHLRRLFDAAEAGGAILLFDEADALFGKRSEVRDSHDRYANIEVGYLLQRVESYRGLALLTTNLKDSLDSAFLRRLRFVLSFPAPDAALRAELWERGLPAEAPRGSIDLVRLARLELTGASIRNVCLHAAFLAASVDEPISTRHLLRAAREEFTRLGRTVPENVLKGAA